MSIYPKIAKNVFLPIGDKLMGTTISKHLKFLEKSQWWPQEDLIKYQNKKLQSLIKHAYENVPYYHRILKELGLYPDDIKTCKELEKLPFLSKKDIKSNYEKISANNIRTRRWDFGSSGGTTGETLAYKRDIISRDFQRASNMRGWGWAGLQLGNKYAYFWSNPNIISNNINKSKKIVELIRRKKLFDMYDVDKEVLRQYVSRMKKFNLKFIRGYAYAIYEFSNVVAEGEIILNGVITTAETLTLDMREKIENKFQCEVFDEYGGEACARANECHTHEGYHIPIEGVIMEFLKDGETVSSGEMGEIVLTDLNNYAMPFIRYKIGDLGVPSDEKCSCGRGLPMLKCIEGRKSDTIVTPDGRILTRPSFFGSANVKMIKGLREYQIVQEKIDKVTIKVIGDEDFTEESRNVTFQLAKSLLGNGVEIDVEEINEIPIAPSGKRKVIVSKLNHDFR